MLLLSFPAILIFICKKGMYWLICLGMRKQKFGGKKLLLYIPLAMKDYPKVLLWRGCWEIGSLPGKGLNKRSKSSLGIFRHTVRRLRN